MSNIFNNQRRPSRKKPRGQSLVECTMALALIALVAIVTLTSLGNQLFCKFGRITAATFGWGGSSLEAQYNKSHKDGGCQE